MSRQRKLPRVLSSRRSDEPVAEWLARLAAALPADGAIDDEVLGDVIRRVNGSLGDEQRQVEADPDAYREFWRTASERLPSHPLARAVYADTLLLTGDTDGARREMLAAFEADPTLIYRVSGEYRDVMQRAGGRQWVSYRALAIRAAELDDPESHGDYIVEEVKDLMTDVGDDPQLRREVLRVLSQGSR